MRSIQVSTCLAALAILLLAGGCSNCSLPGVDEIGNLFGGDCAPPVAEAPPCEPPPQPAPVCEPTPPPVYETASEPEAPRPTNVRAGEVWCYVRVPAVTRTVEERVCLRPETCREVQIPAKTQQVARQVCTKPASVRYEEIPATYEDRSKQICTAPARTEWARVDCNPTQLQPKEQVGECWTLREIPPQYTVQTERVCTCPSSRREIPIPAEYETRYETVVVEPARVERVPVPAEYETRLKEVVVQGPRWEWRRTHECEVPDAAGTYQPAPVAPDAYQPAPAPSDDYVPPPAPIQLPDDNGPPAGGLPPLR